MIHVVDVASHSVVCDCRKKLFFDLHEVRDGYIACPECGYKTAYQLEPAVGKQVKVTVLLEWPFKATPKICPVPVPGTSTEKLLKRLPVNRVEVVRMCPMKYKSSSWTQHLNSRVDFKVVNSVHDAVESHKTHLDSFQVVVVDRVRDAVLLQQRLTKCAIVTGNSDQRTRSDVLTKIKNREVHALVITEAMFSAMLPDLIRAGIAYLHWVGLKRMTPAVIAHLCSTTKLIPISFYMREAPTNWPLFDSNSVKRNLKALGDALGGDTIVFTKAGEP